MGFSDAEAPVVSRYFNMPKLSQGETTEVRILVVDESPVYMWQHRIGVRPFICPGERNGCPACIERKAAQAAGIPKEQVPWKISKRWKANILLVDRNEVKILEFSNELLKKLGQWEQRLAKNGKSLHSQVFSFVKTQSGPRKQDVDYDLLPDESDYELTDEQRAALESKYDLQKEIVPADPAKIEEAINRERGGQQTSPSVANAAGAEAAGADQAPATETQIKLLEGAVKAKGFELIDIIGVGRKPETLTKAEVANWITKLAS